MRISQGRPIARERKQRYLLQDKYIAKATEKLEQGRYTVYEFLRATSHSFQGFIDQQLRRLNIVIPNNQMNILEPEVLPDPPMPLAAPDPPMPLAAAPGLIQPLALPETQQEEQELVETAVQQEVQPFPDQNVLTWYDLDEAENDFRRRQEHEVMPDEWAAWGETLLQHDVNELPTHVYERK